jgi:hypothetical protein
MCEFTNGRGQRAESRGQYIYIHVPREASGVQLLHVISRRTRALHCGGKKGESRPDKRARGKRQESCGKRQEAKVVPRAPNFDAIVTRAAASEARERR